MVWEEIFPCRSWRGPLQNRYPCYGPWRTCPLEQGDVFCSHKGTAATGELTESKLKAWGWSSCRGELIGGAHRPSLSLHQSGLGRETQSEAESGRKMRRVLILMFVFTSHNPTLFEVYFPEVKCLSPTVVDGNQSPCFYLSLWSFSPCFLSLPT